MKRRSPDEQLEFLIVHASRLVIKKYYSKFSRLGLNPSQITALVHLERTGAMNQTELAKKLALGKAATGTLLEGLEKENLIRRSRDSSDHRAIVVTISKAGRTRIQDVDEIAEDLGTRMRKGVDSAERKNFIKTLNTLLNNLREMP